MIINETYFKEYSPIPLNYDWKEMTNYVEIAEAIWVKPLLGDDLFEEIEDQIEHNNLSDENATLLTDGNVWRYLSFATCLEGLAFIWTNFSEVGITLGKSDNSDSISLKDLTYVESNLRRQVEVLKEQVYKFLSLHQDSFPLWDKETCECSCFGKTKLKKPNRYQQLYRTRPIPTRIK